MTGMLKPDARHLRHVLAEYETISTLIGHIDLSPKLHLCDRWPTVNLAISRSSDAIDSVESSMSMRR